MARHWTLNGRFLTRAMTGVQRYGREITLALDDLVGAGHHLTTDVDFEIAVPDSAPEWPELKHIRMRRIAGSSGHGWEQLVLPLHVRGGLISLCNTGPVMLGKHIACIHDANTRLCPQSYSWKFRALYRVLHRALGARAARVTTVSRFSAQQLSRFGIADDKAVVIGNGHEHALRWTARHSAASRAVAGPDTVVLFGSMAPHKNIGLLLGLAEQLEKNNLRLAIIGAANPRVFADAGVASDAGNVTWLGRLSDEESCALLRDSLCLAFPSTFEGFGLPPIEAMALGTPVVASDASCLPEICGAAALYASPTSPQDWLERLVQLRRDHELRASLVELGHRQAARYSWRASALAYLEQMSLLDGITVRDGHRAQPVSSPALRDVAVSSSSCQPLE